MSTGLESTPDGDGAVFSYEVRRIYQEGFETSDLDKARTLLEQDGITVLYAHVNGGDTQSHERRGEIDVRPNLAEEKRARMIKFGFGVTTPTLQV